MVLSSILLSIDHPHSEDEQDSDKNDKLSEEVHSNQGEDHKLLDGRQKSGIKRTGNLLEVPSGRKKDIVSVTSTKKATIDGDEPGMEETIEQRVQDLREIHQTKARPKVDDNEEEKHMRLENDPPNAAVDEGQEAANDPKEKPRSNLAKYALVASAVVAIGYLLFRKK